MAPKLTLSRRAFLRQSALASTGVVIGSRLVGCTQPSDTPPVRVVSAADRIDGSHVLVVTEVGGPEGVRVLSEIPVADRGHGAALCLHRGWVALAARRPGRQLIVVDLTNGELVVTIEAVAARHFFGHAVFDQSGRYLYATENVFVPGELTTVEPLEAVIGVYDLDRGGERVREFRTHGVGAHELAFFDDDTLVVANGGIYTHPELAREKLNLETMDPSLVLLDASSGALRAQYRLLQEEVEAFATRDADVGQAHQLSVRHLAVSPDGRVFVALQYEGEREHRVPLMAVLDGERFAPLGLPSEVLESLQNYVASVVCDEAGVLLSSPVGDRVIALDPDGQYLHDVRIPDVCGLGCSGGVRLATAGTGAIYLFEAGGAQVVSAFEPPRYKWDNHLALVTL